VEIIVNVILQFASTRVSAQPELAGMLMKRKLADYARVLAA
jgi:hypothetical protein